MPTDFGKQERMDACGRYVAQAEQLEAELGVAGTSCIDDLYDAQQRWFRLTAFLSFVLLPSMLITHFSWNATRMVDRWQRTLALHPELMLNLDGTFIQPVLYSSVASSLVLYNTGDMQLFEPFSTEESF